MCNRSTPFALFLALLLLLWQPLCLCDAEGGEGGHTHGAVTHATEADGHHDGNSPASHHHAKGDHHDQRKDAPCDDHDNGCDCSKNFTGTQKTSESGKTGLEGLSQPVIAWSPVTVVEPPLLPHHGLRGVARQGLPPPPLLKLYRVLLI